MHKYALAAAAIVCGIMNITGPASAEPIKLTICVGGPTGNYATVVAPKVAEQIAERFAVTMVTTKGSPEIQERLSKPLTDPGSCQMAPIQKDAFAGNTSGNIEDVGTLYPEYVHLLCAKSSGVTSIDDFLSNKKLVLGTGSDFSGNAVVWRNIVRADKRYADIPTVPLSLDSKGAIALTKGDVACILAVTGIKSKAINAFANQVDDVVLTSFWDSKFGSLKVNLNGKESALYTKAEIPGGTYPRSIQPSGWFSGSAVTTLAVDSVLVYRTDWLAGLPEAVQEYVLNGTIKARRNIKAVLAN